MKGYKVCTQLADILYNIRKRNSCVRPPVELRNRSFTGFSYVRIPGIETPEADRACTGRHLSLSPQYLFLHTGKSFDINMRQIGSCLHNLQKIPDASQLNIFHFLQDSMQVIQQSAIQKQHPRSL